MKTHEGLPVHGYQKQSEVAVALVNAHKVAEEQLLRHMDHMREDGENFDQRWLAIARTQFEKGFMALNRAVFKPKRLDGELPDMEAVWAEMKQRLGM